MVVKESPALDRIFQALANPSRRAMLRMLTDGEQNISSLAEPLQMSFEGASKHVRVLEQAGLVARRVRGRVHLVRIRPMALVQANEWLEFYTRFWNQQMDALEAMFDEE
ncbi:MAG: winged helix-turn-helix transcriptional regulator [Anaerolineales bacterium]|nr:MAG: winged helix-turn-helix transcriptional regulator [Anaerolineales bacterium]